MERLVPGRYAVVFRQETPEEVIDRTMSLLRDAHHRTDGKITANHFDKLEHAARGFFATLSENLVPLVSACQRCDKHKAAHKETCALILLAGYGRPQEACSSWSQTCSFVVPMTTCPAPCEGVRGD